MSNLPIAGLSVTSPTFNTIGQKIALFGNRTYSLFQYRFIAGITLVVATVASLFIGIAATARIAIEFDDIIPDVVSTSLCLVAIFGFVLAVNVGILRGLQLPLGRLSSVGISIMSLAAASIGLILHDLR